MRAVVLGEPHGRLSRWNVRIVSLAGPNSGGSWRLWRLPHQSARRRWRSSRSESIDHSRTWDRWPDRLLDAGVGAEGRHALARPHLRRLCLSPGRPRESLRRRLCSGCTSDGGFATQGIAGARFAFPLGRCGSDVALAPLLCAGLISYCSLEMAGEGLRSGFTASAQLAPDPVVANLTCQAGIDRPAVTRKAGVVISGSYTGLTRPTRRLLICAPPVARAPQCRCPERICPGTEPGHHRPKTTKSRRQLRRSRFRSQRR